MLTTQIDLTSCWQANVVTLTPNHRLAAYLHEACQQQQITAGNYAWQQPAIYAINTWLDKLWQDLFSVILQPSKKLLTLVEQQLIWEQIIGNSTAGAGLFEISSTAVQAIEAWNTLLKWDLLTKFLANELEQPADSAIFSLWAREYFTICEKNNWLDFQTMLNLMIKDLKALTSLLPTTCYLVECQELAPQYSRFFLALEAIGCKVLAKQLTTKVLQDIAVVALASKEEEYRVAITWAKQIWQQTPNARIGIVVPDLAVNRETIANVAAEILPASVYNISAPRAMAQYAMIDIALLLLQLSSRNTITIYELAKLLRSGFITKAITEMEQRAMLTIALQNLGEQEFTYDYLAKYYTALAPEHIANAPQFIMIWQQWLELLPSLAGKHDSEYWLPKIYDILTIWGWPGENIHGKTEYELLSCWQLLLQHYLQLTEVLQQHDFLQASKVCQKLAINTPFLPETGKVTIHILGLLEAAGLPFARLWLMNMDNNSWPRAPEPNPFIAINLQRQYNMPKSSPARELLIAKELTRTFCRSADQQVIFSFTKIIDDVPTTASKLIAQFKTVTITDLIGEFQNVPAYLLNKETIVLEEYFDNQGPSFTLPTTVSGGSKALELQANCPFRAFAELRLRAVPMTAACIGLTPAERGALVHAVLAKFWQQAKNQQYLLKLTTTKLQDLINKYIIEYLQLLKKQRPLTLTSNYMQLEAERMQDLIGKWLNYEKQRTPFVVYQIEQQQLLPLGDLTFKLRLDRIDQLVTGEIIIIDYKTKKIAAAEWFNQRLKNPQLPMYCLATAIKPSAIAFAIIRPEALAFTGVTASVQLFADQAAEQLLSKGNINAWQQQNAAWQEQLITLATEFQQGIAIVQPLMGLATCRHCKLQPLCRIYEKIIR